MAYIVQDPEPGMIAKYAQAAKFKSTVLANMPRATYGGIECLAAMRYYEWKNFWYRYDNGTPVWGTTAGKTEAKLQKMFNILGIKPETIYEKASDYSQLEEAWFYFKTKDVDIISVSDAQIKHYIETFSPLIYPTHTDVFNPVNNVCPVVPVTTPITPCVFTNLNPDPNPVAVYETRLTGESVFVNGVMTPVTEQVLISGPMWDSMGWVTSTIAHQPVTSILHNKEYWDTIYESDATIINEVLAFQNIIMKSPEEIGAKNNLTLIALLDTTGVLFEKQFTVRRVVTMVESPVQDITGTTTMQKQAVTSHVVIMKFRRIHPTTDTGVSALIALVQAEVAKVEAARLLAAQKNLNSFDASTYGYAVPPSAEEAYRASILDAGRTAQITAMHRYEVTSAANGLIVYNNTWVTGENSGGHYRIDALTAMSPSQFEALIRPSLAFDARVYSKKNATFSIGSFLTAVVAVGGMVVIAMFPPVAPLATATTATYVYSLPIIAMYLSGYALALAALSMAVARMGILDMAKQFSVMSQMYFMAASVTGIGGMIQNGMQQVASKSIYEAIKEYVTSSIKSIVDVVLDPIGAISTFVQQSTFSIMNSTLNFLSKAFNVYANYINPPNKGLGELAEQLAASDKAVKDSEVVKPDMIDTVNKELNDPYDNWIDLNEKMQLMPFYMTAGQNINLMSKYYNSGY